MKALIKPVKFQTVSPRIYGYEEDGENVEYGRPTLFHEDSSGALYFDCVADDEYPVCPVTCWWISHNGYVVHEDPSCPD